MKLEILSVLLLAASVELIPSNFKRCNRKDPNFKKCYFEAAQFGVTLLTRPYKSMDLPNLEPLEVTEMTVPGGTGVVALDQRFRNCKMHGLTAVKFDRFELNLEKKILDVVGTIPSVVLNCEYKLDGRILLFTLKGQGNSTVVLDRLHIVFHAEYKEVEREGKAYYRSVSNKLTSQPKNVTFNFENLFDGNKELGDNVNTVLNENWKEIWSDVKESYNKIIENIIKQVVDGLWAKVSLEEFFD